MEFWHIKDVVAEGLEFINTARNSDRLMVGLTSGFIDLDILTTGFHPSDFVVVAGRPGTGKSSLMLSMALHIALEENVPVAIFSLETTKRQLILRMLSILSGVPLQNIRRGFVSNEDWVKIVRLGMELSARDIYIDDSPMLTITEFRTKSKKLREEKNVGIIFVDYLQLLKTPYKGISRQEEVAEISRNLKALAKELDVPVVALAQLSRQVEKRKDRRPKLMDLRESGQIEQDADIILFIHRPSAYKLNPSPEEERIAEIIVAKQRQGPTGIIKLSFVKETTAFTNLPPTYFRPKLVEEKETTSEDLELDF
jgi:replicative DNA helicase